MIGKADAKNGAQDRGSTGPCPEHIGCSAEAHLVDELSGGVARLLEKDPVEMELGKAIGASEVFETEWSIQVGIDESGNAVHRDHAREEPLG